MGVPPTSITARLGLVTQTTTAPAFTGRTLTAGSTRVNIVAGNGSTGNPTVDVNAFPSTYLSDTSVIVRNNSTSGSTFAGALSVPDAAYSSTGWDGSLEVPTKNAVRDKIESLGGSSLSTTTALCSGDLSTTTSYQDVTGVTMTLGAGTYLLLATASVEVASGGANTITVKLYNQSDTVDLVASAASPAGNGYYECIALSHILTLAASKTIRMAAVQNNGTGGVVKRYGDAPAPSPASIPGTYLRAIQIG
jgi:hypothetical protein